MGLKEGSQINTSLAEGLRGTATLFSGDSCVLMKAGGEESGQRVIRLAEVEVGGQDRGWEITRRGR